MIVFYVDLSKDFGYGFGFDLIVYWCNCIVVVGGFLFIVVFFSGVVV